MRRIWGTPCINIYPTCLTLYSIRFFVLVTSHILASIPLYRASLLYGLSMPRLLTVCPPCIDGPFPSIDSPPPPVLTVHPLLLWLSVPHCTNCPFQILLTVRPQSYWLSVPRCIDCGPLCNDYPSPWQWPFLSSAMTTPFLRIDCPSPCIDSPPILYWHSITLNWLSLPTILTVH